MGKLNMDNELKIPPYTGIEDIVFDSEGTIWLATNRGLGRFKNGDFKLFNEADGLVRPDGNCDVNIGKNEENNIQYLWTWLFNI